MRRVHVRRSLERIINDVLGTDVAAVESPTVPDLTGWSIQAAMLENIKRVGESLVGFDAGGRVMSGLSMSHPGYSDITIQPGVCITPNGDVIILGASVTVSVSNTGFSYIFLTHTESETADGVDGGLSTNFIGDNGLVGSKQIITYDDLITFLGASVQPSNITIQTGAYPTFSKDSVYLGSVEGETFIITPYFSPGFVSILTQLNALFDDSSLLAILGDCLIDGTMNVSGQTTLNNPITVDVGKTDSLDAAITVNSGCLFISEHAGGIMMPDSSGVMWIVRVCTDGTLQAELAP